MDGHQCDLAAVSHSGAGPVAADAAPQWSGRQGQQVLHTQLATGPVSALLLSVVNMTAYVHHLRFLLNWRHLRQSDSTLTTFLD